MIWYACYGSNLDLQRFMVYLQGGSLTVGGTVKNYKHCEKDTAMPRESEPYFIEGQQLYFAKESKTWNGRGVAFLRGDHQNRVYARLYLISKVQFEHLFASENGRASTKVDFDTILKYKFQDFDYTFYNRIALLDEDYKGFPVLTFTNKENLPKNEPLDEYIQLIVKGLGMVHQLDNNQIIEYLTASGIDAPKEYLKSNNITSSK